MKFFGTSDDQDLTGLMRAAEQEMQRGEWAKADQLLQRAVRAADQRTTDDHEPIANVYSLAAATAFRLNDMERAIGLSRRALNTLEKRNVEDELLFNELNNLGTFLRFNDQRREAFPFLDRAIKMHYGLKGRDNPLTVRMTACFAQFLLELNEVEEAQVVMDVLFDTCHHAGTALVEEQVHAIELLCEELRSREQTTACEELCKREMGYLANQVGDLHPALSVPAAELGKCYLTMQKFEEANEWLTITYNMRSQLMGPEHSATGKAAQLLGIFWASMGHDEEALKFYDEALNIARKNRDGTLAMSVMRSYISCLNRLGRTQDAQRLQEESARIEAGIGI